MKDISPSIQQYFSQKQQEFIGMIEGKIDNATANVETHFKENYKAIETLRNQVGVNPNKDLYNEAGNRFAYVEEKQNNIENKIDVGKGQIHKIEPPKWTEEVKKYTKDTTNPIELGKNIFDYGKENKAWGTAIAIGGGASLLGTAIEYAPLAKKGFDFVKDGVSKVWSTVRNVSLASEGATTTLK